MSRIADNQRMQKDRAALTGLRFKVVTSLPTNRGIKDFEGTLFTIFDLGLMTVKFNSTSLVVRRTPFWFLDNLANTASHICINQEYIIRFIPIPKEYNISKKEEKFNFEFKVEDLIDARIQATIVSNGKLVEVVEGNFNVMVDLDTVFWRLTDVNILESKTSKFDENKIYYNMNNIACFKILKTKDGKTFGSDDFWQNK